VLIPGVSGRPSHADLRRAEAIAAAVMAQLDRALPATEP
jgi:hypothetical protein